MKEIFEDLSVSVRLLIVGIIIFSVVYTLSIGAVGQALWNDSADGSMIEQNGEIVGSKLIGQEFDGPEFFHGRPSSIDYNAMESSSQNLAPQIGTVFNIENEEIRASLNPGPVSEELERKFMEEDHALPQNSIIEEDGGRWIVTSDNEELYFIQEDEEKLDVYKKSVLAKRVQRILEEIYENRPENAPDIDSVPSVLVTESGSALDPHITVEAAIFQIPRVSQHTGISEQKLESLIEEYSKEKLLNLYGMKRINVLKLNLEVHRLMEEG